MAILSAISSFPGKTFPITPIHNQHDDPPMLISKGEARYVILTALLKTMI